MKVNSLIRVPAYKKKPERLGIYTGHDTHKAHSICHNSVLILDSRDAMPVRLLLSDEELERCEYLADAEPVMNHLYSVLGGELNDV